LSAKVFDTSDNMIWLDYLTVDYTNWTVSQPNAKDEKCVTMWVVIVSKFLLEITSFTITIMVNMAINGFTT
jgi:hypothetical protein